MSGTNLDTYKEQLMTDDTFVLAEVRRIQHLYNLKREIRYAQRRQEEVRTESVAEHVYGMHIVAAYFFDLEDRERTLNRERVMELITWHDIGEIETGDTLSQFKTEADRARDKEGNELLLAKLPPPLKDYVATLLEEYEAQTTPEARYAKAIDKSEVIFEIYDDNYREIFRRNQTTREHNRKTKFPYVSSYPFINRFCQVVSAELERGGFFVD